MELLRLVRLSVCGLLSVCACGTAAPLPAAKAPQTLPTHTSRTPIAAEDDDDFQVESDIGIVSEEASEREFAAHGEALKACYLNGLGGRTYVGGDVTIHWTVTPQGALRRVYLSPNDLGDWTIEKCLLERARKFNFGKPRGQGDADIEMAMQLSVDATEAWDEEAAQLLVGDLLAPARKKCKGGPADMKVTFYLKHGKVLSSGFSREGEIPETWASCVQGQMASWSLTKRNRITKLTFVWGRK